MRPQRPPPPRHRPVRVGTRITVTTSAVAAVALVGFAFFLLRARHLERRRALVDEAVDLAQSIRATVEAIGVDEALARPDAIARAVTRAGSPWRVLVLDAAALAGPRSPDRAAALARLDRLIALRLPELVVNADDQLAVALPLRVPNPDHPDGVDIVGGVDLTRSTAFLRSRWLDEVLEAVLAIAAIMAALIAVIALTVRRTVAGPIDKLIAGIDSVAQGDLSGVLLAEHDDEIGALASRFNEMTFSLRESKAETARQNQARLALEQRLAETARLATMGQMAAEIAHEVGTPLNVISGRARALARKADSPAAVEKNATIIAEQAARITRIIQRLLDFTRRKVGAVDPEAVNLNEVTLTTMEFLENQLAKAQIRHVLTRAEGLPPVRGSADQLQQVFLNLFLNAIQAMPAGGSLEVETSVVERKRPGLESDPASSFVRVTVADSGPGIPESIRDKIFEPFYTSREGEGGTGLGLAVCQGIVRDHDGWIEVADNPGGGTVFTVYLPADPAG
ncbi:MAG: HAMP domain-containing protein [Deltaproteobacteria bacterium]|nr:MAG: HAMP domain-containing protein [Deltaproteobacteria bacterium]